MPIRIKGADIGPRGVAPDLGQHTTEVLTEAGLSQDKIATLLADGVIGPPPSGDPKL